MKKTIDDYLKHLELKRKGINIRRQAILREEDKNFRNKKKERKITATRELKKEIEKIDRKIEFIKKLGKELLLNEVCSQKKRK